MGKQSTASGKEIAVDGLSGRTGDRTTLLDGGIVGIQNAFLDIKRCPALFTPCVV